MRIVEAARRGALMGVLTKVSGISLPPEIAGRPDTIVPHFIATRLPAGVVGLIVASLLSAAMSSVSADLNSVATVATEDYFARALPHTSNRTRLWFGRLAVAIGGLLSIAAALVLTMTRSVAAYEVVVISVSIIAAGMLGLFGLGFFTRRATRAGSHAGLAACLLFVTWATVTGPLKIDLGFNYRMNSILIGVFSHIVLFAVGYVVSVVFGGYRPDLRGLTVWDAAPASESQ